MLQRLKDEDVQIATADKEVVFREDKTTLYRYKSTAKRTIGVPVLVVYGLIGRYTMTDLQEDRSLVRNLLARGVDRLRGRLGQPDARRPLADLRGLRRLVPRRLRRAHLPARTASPAINLLGICEGGVFSTLLRRAAPGEVKNLILTITPIDFHADQAEDATRATASSTCGPATSTDDDIDRLIDAFGNLPGEIMASCSR